MDSWMAGTGRRRSPRNAWVLSWSWRWRGRSCDAEISNKIFLKPTKRVASEMGRRGRREAVEALGLTKQEAKQKPPRRWRKPFQCLDQCCNFSCGFSIMCSRKFGGSYRCAPGYWGHHHTHFLCQGEGWCVDVEWKLSTEFWGKMSEIYVQLYPICSTYGNIYLHLP